jgi:bacillithiol biosynthesis cysteine-adding enzyme BshC
VLHVASLAPRLILCDSTSLVPANLSDSSTRIAVDVRRLPGISRLAADYAYDFKAVAPFFSGDPADRAAWTRAIATAQAGSPRRKDVAAIISAQQQRRDAPPRAVDAGRTLADPRTVAVVTGQQAGLFGGPLYTLLKALSAIKLAEQIAREHQVPVVPIFWIEGEDHDWDEVRSCTVFDDSLTPRTVTLPSELMLEPCPVASVRLDDSIAAALDELERILPPTEFRSTVMSDLRAIYAPGSGMADGFGRWMERILGQHGLIVFDASDPDAKPLAGSVFTRELSTPGGTMTRVKRTGADLEGRGYHAQVQPQEDAVALFVLDGGRQSIRRQNGQLLVGEHAALVEEAAENPAGFSQNVLLRPIVQDTLFPTACYVAGPNELAYLAQLKTVYEYFGLTMPLIAPRASATLVDSGALKFLAKSQLPLEALQAQDEAALNALLASQIPPHVDASLAAASEAVAEKMEAVIQAMPAVDPTLEGAAKSTLGKMQHDLQSLRGKMILAAKRRDETLRRQFQRTQALAYPNGHPQEREIGFVSFLNQYGPALVERLLAELPLGSGTHWVMTI